MQKKREINKKEGKKDAVELRVRNIVTRRGIGGSSSPLPPQARERWSWELQPSAELLRIGGCLASKFLRNEKNLSCYQKYLFQVDLSIERVLEAAFPI